MLKQLVELARAKKQVNIAFTALGADRYLLGIAPANAGTDKIAPFIAKGTLEEIMEKVHCTTAIPDYVIASLSKKTDPAKPADPATDEDEENEETETTDTTDGKIETPEPEPPAVEPAPEAPAAAPVKTQPTFTF